MVALGFRSFNLLVDVLHLVTAFDGTPCSYPCLHCLVLLVVLLIRLWTSVCRTAYVVILCLHVHFWHTPLRVALRSTASQSGSNFPWTHLLGFRLASLFACPTFSRVCMKQRSLWFGLQVVGYRLCHPCTDSCTPVPCASKACVEPL